ncbi:MAG: toxin-antitoxin system YwqK family antitoxin [Bacteroidia bacterium]
MKYLLLLVFMMVSGNELCGQSLLQVCGILKIDYDSLGASIKTGHRGFRYPISGSKYLLVEYEENLNDVFYAVEQIHVNDTFLYHGRSVTYYGNNLVQFGQDKNGKPHGTTKYFRNDTLEKVEHYRNGLLHGKKTLHYKTGEVHHVGKYRNHKPTGVFKEFYKNGELKEKGKYTNNKRIDSSCIGDTTISYMKGFGKIVSIRSMPCIQFYKKGVWKYYNKEGRLIEKRRHPKSAYKHLPVYEE